MIRLHHVPGSRSFRVLWLLEELGLPVELRLWSLTDGGLRSAEFRALSPGARVPALEIDGRAIFESGAIVEYLCETRGRLAPAPGAPDRADFLEWLHYAETQATILQNLNFHHIFLRPESARSVAMTRLDTRRLALSLQALETRLEQRDWLLGDFSAADCMMGFNTDAIFRFLARADYPATAAYCARAAARPAFGRALARGGASTIYGADFYEMPDG